MEVDKGIAHERAAIMKLYVKQASVDASRYKMGQSTYLGKNFLPEPMKLGAASNIYSSKKNSTLDDKFSPAKPFQGYKLRQIDSVNIYQSPEKSLYEKNNLECGVIGYQ